MILPVRIGHGWQVEKPIADPSKVGMTGRFGGPTSVRLLMAKERRLQKESILDWPSSDIARMDIARLMGAVEDDSRRDEVWWSIDNDASWKNPRCSLGIPPQPDRRGQVFDYSLLAW